MTTSQSDDMIPSGELPADLAGVHHRRTGVPTTYPLARPPLPVRSTPMPYDTIGPTPASAADLEEMRLQQDVLKLELEFALSDLQKQISHQKQFLERWETEFPVSGPPVPVWGVVPPEDAAEWQEQQTVIARARRELGALEKRLADLEHERSGVGEVGAEE